MRRSPSSFAATAVQVPALVHGAHECREKGGACLVAIDLQLRGQFWTGYQRAFSAHANLPLGDWFFKKKKGGLGMTDVCPLSDNRCDMPCWPIRHRSTRFQTGQGTGEWTTRPVPNVETRLGRHGK